jgi:hypothetical protein
MIQQRRTRLAGTRRLVAAIAALDLVIVAGIGFHLAGGTAIGSALSANGGVDPVALLGTELGTTTCPTAPLAIGEGTTVVCPDWTGITTPEGLVEVVSLYGPGNAVLDEYRGALPEGLAWGQGLTDVVAMLGSPIRITDAYGTPTLVYAYEDKAYGSLELRFSAGDRLMRINACLLH